MFLNNRSDSFLPLLLSIILLCQLQPVLSVSQETKSPDVVVSGKMGKLSEESAQLLERLKKDVMAYNDKLKNGKIEFSITMSQQSRNQRAKNVQYEETGRWYIIHNFDGQRQFYDVKSRRKMEFNGEMYHRWKESHYQFQFVEKKFSIKEQKGTEWVQHPQPTDKSIFEPEFNPRRWGWHPGVFSFRSLIKYAPPIKVEQVEVDGVQLYLLTLHRVNSEKRFSTIQLWVDPRKGYRTTRVLTSHTSVVQGMLEGPDGKLRLLQPEKAVIHRSYTYQIGQFDPGIWFPQNATMETFGSDMQIPPQRKIVMQVHKAIFNIPIAEKDLRFSD